MRKADLTVGLYRISGVIAGMSGIVAESGLSDRWVEADLSTSAKATVDPP